MKNVDTITFKGTLQSLNLHQYILDATHVKGHMLDLVLTRTGEAAIQSLQVNPSAVSDHYPIIFQLLWKRSTAPHRRIHLSKYKDIDLAAFSEDVKNSALTQNLPVGASEDSERTLLYNNHTG